MSEKLEELISLLYQDRLTQYGKRLLIENIEKIQKENKELKNFRRNFVDVTDKELKEANDYFSRKYTFMGDELAQHINQKIENEENEKVIVWLHKQISVLQELLEGR